MMAFKCIWLPKAREKCYNFTLMC
uniref:Uncharacterized protein n=1 Tax=Rhizophora mucronata TaxID=61149 RepID=A0A2P2Q463_RHIMU